MYLVSLCGLDSVERTRSAMVLARYTSGTKSCRFTRKAAGRREKLPACRRNRQTAVNSRGPVPENDELPRTSASPLRKNGERPRTSADPPGKMTKCREH